MAIEGVDYAWIGPSPAALKAAGKQFACRYGGPGSDGKQLHAAELAALRAAGIDVVANAEGAANGFRGTAAGQSWASQARDHFGALGMPTGRPIYFSVDWDAGGPGDWQDIDAALRGAASVIGAAQVGVYGSYDVMAHCRAAGTARWFWQTYAWSGGRSPASYVHLYQYKNGVTIGGADCDLTRALIDDYGQWGYVEPKEPDVELTDKYGDDAYAGRTVQDRFKDDAKSRDLLFESPTGTGYKTADKAIPANAAIRQIMAMPGQIAKLTAAVAALNPVAFADAVIARLPESADPISQEEVTNAVKAAFEDAFRGPES